MIKKIALVAVAILLTVNVFAQTEPANYRAAIAKFKTFFNNGQADSIYKMFGPEMMAALNPEQTRATMEQLKGQVGALSQIQYISMQEAALYKASFENAVLAMHVVLNGQNKIIGLLFNAYQEPSAKAPPAASAQTMDTSLTESAFDVKTLAGVISGTLTMPKSAQGKVPVVLIIAGSGPIERNGVANGYFQLAEELGKKGIATVRYDKRGVGKSTSSAKEIDSRFTDLVADAASLIGELKSDERFSKVIVLGHSEGSLVGMLASNDTKINGFVSLAGPGQTIDKTLLEQFNAQSPMAANALKPVLDSLRKGVKVDKVDASVYSIARPSMQPYLMSWMMYDPAREIRKLKCPILIVQGTTDLQVKVDDAQKLKKAKSDAELAIITGMNHVLKEAPLDRQQNIATYSQPALPLKPELVTSIANFVNKLK